MLPPVLPVSVSLTSSITGFVAMAGCIHAATGPMKRESAWKVAKFGPVTAWSLNCDANAVQV